MKHSGILIVVSGFSGAGKGTLMKQLVHAYDNYALSVSMTTRKPRPGEQEGREDEVAQKPDPAPACGLPETCDREDHTGGRCRGDCRGAHQVQRDQNDQAETLSEVFGAASQDRREQRDRQRHKRDKGGGSDGRHYDGSDKYPALFPVGSGGFA